MPPTGHVLVVAGNHVFGLRSDGNGETTATCSVFTLDGKKVAANTLPSPAPTGDKLEKIRGTVGRETWGINYSCPFTVAGDRLHIPSNDALLCLGAK